MNFATLIAAFFLACIVWFIIKLAFEEYQDTGPIHATLKAIAFFLVAGLSVAGACAILFR